MSQPSSSDILAFFALLDEMREEHKAYVQLEEIPPDERIEGLKRWHVVFWLAGAHTIGGWTADTLSELAQIIRQESLR